MNRYETEMRQICAQLNAKLDTRVDEGIQTEDEPIQPKKEAPCDYRKTVPEELQQALMDTNACWAMTSDERSFDHLPCTLREYSHEQGCWQCLHPKRPSMVVDVCTAKKVCLLLHPCKECDYSKAR